jgi:hypothetical protein
LPFSLKDAQAAFLAVELNEMEYIAVDAVPYFGSWCASPGSGRPTFVCFIPNFFPTDITPANIYVWMMHRSNFARAAIRAMSQSK